MNDVDYMKKALALAKKGAGFVNPNPMVGAIIVKDGSIIGQGYHECFGGAHAERNALSSCTESPKGATLFVTLEPCCHTGKTPPCTEAIIASGIQRVVIGTLDPNRLVAGKGAAILREHHIEVEVGLLETDCRHLIRAFEKFISTGLPYVCMKYAMTMDGKMSTSVNHSKWISCEAARHHVHQTRHEFSAIMIGVNTLLQDDPLLTCRISQGSNPIRIICDTHLKTPLTSNIVQTAASIETYIATACIDEIKRRPYEQIGCHFITVDKKGEHLDLKALMKYLGKMNIDSLLLEGGSTLNGSALELQLVDEVQLYLAPKLFGGMGKTPIGGHGITFPDEAVRLKPYALTQIGSDYLIESEVVYECSPVS